MIADPASDRLTAKSQDSSLLRVDELEVDFLTEHGRVTVVDGASLSVGRGETVGLVGESGSGKTVTGLAVMGLLPRSIGRIAGGRIDFNGTDITSLPDREMRSLRGNDIAMVFQEPMTSLNPAYTVGEQIAETVRRHRGASRRAARERAIEMLGRVGIPAPSRRFRAYPHEFSGGMRQRVMIAMALSCEPKLLIADEPTTALDVTIQAQMIELMRSIIDESDMSLLFITHDLGVVADLCDRVVVMYAGQVVEQADVDTLFYSPSHPYTGGLLASLPQVASTSRGLTSIPGRPPEPWNFPQGCRFHPRCAYAVESCRSGPIPLLERTGGAKTRCIRVDEITVEGIDG